MVKYNPQNNPYRPHLNDEVLDTLIDKSKTRFYFEKKIYFSHMSRKYMDQIERRLEQRAAKMPDMLEANRWKNDVRNTLKQFLVPIKGYEFDERTATLITTEKIQSFKGRVTSAFSCTIESPYKLKRALGYLTAGILVGFCLYGGYVVKKMILASSETAGARAATLEEIFLKNDGQKE